MNKYIKLIFLSVLLISTSCFADSFGGSFYDSGPNFGHELWHADPNGYYGTEASPPSVSSALEELGASFATVYATGWTDNGATIETTTSTDFVGIGITPSVKFQVASDAGTDNCKAYFNTYKSNGNAYSRFYSQKSWSNTLGVNAETGIGWLGTWRFQGCDSNDAVKDGAVIAAYQSGAARVDGVPTDLYFETEGPVSRNNFQVFLESSGEVGIGTNVPVYGLDVWGTLGIGTTTAGDALIVASNGNVGIGTAVPLTNLDIEGTTTSNKINLGGGLTSFVLNGVSLDGIVGATSQIATEMQYIALQHSNTAAAGSRFMLSRSRGTLAAPTVVVDGDALAAIDFAGYDGTDYVLGAQIDVEADGTVAGNRVDSSMLFKTSNNSVLPTERMRIKSGGNVGIGTTAPVYGLDVLDTIPLGIGTTTAGDSLVVTSAGNVGIGSTEPLTTLDVDGTATADYFIGNPRKITVLISSGDWDLDSNKFVHDLDATTYPYGIVIDKWVVYASVAAPAVELNANLMYCDAIGTGAIPGANPVLIDVLDSTTGNSTETDMSASDLGSGIIASTKVLYVDIDVDPATDDEYYILQIWYTKPRS